MTFKEVEFQDFRIYKGSNTIYLAPTEDKNITVVSGLNGFGKTTFLMGLVWCLYGRQMDQVDTFYKKEIKDNGGYDAYIGNSLNRLAKKEGHTKFSVRIIISDLNIPEIPCQEISITRKYDTVTGSSDVVKILIDGHENELVKDMGDDKLTAEEMFIRDFIMPIEIAKFFFFDAEKIISLAEVSTKEQRKDLNQAYSEVLGIKKYEDLKDQLEEYQLRLRQDSASKKEKEELENLKRDSNLIEDALEEITEAIEELDNEKIKLEHQSKQIQDKLIRQGNQMTIEELEKLRKEAGEKEEAIKVLEEELRSTYEIIPFAIAGDLLAQVAKQIELEAELESAEMSQQEVEAASDKIINDLVSRPKPSHIVIDYRVEDYYKQVIKELIKKHFYSETPTIEDGFESVHDYNKGQQNELAAFISHIKLAFKEQFKRINSNYNFARNELTRLRQRLKAAEANAEDPVISKLREEKDRIDKRVSEIEELLISKNQEIGGLKNKHGMNKRRIDEISKKIEVSNKSKEKDKTARRLIDELQDFIEQFKQEKKVSLEKEILAGLNSLMHKKSFIKEVQVDIIGEEIDIQLLNARGEIIKKEGLSNGEKQMYASALLKGLVEESDIEFPVFIDSPMQKFDIKHAENIVKYFYPNISDQVVIFPLVKKEMTEEEYDIILPKVSNAYLIQQISDDQSGFKEVTDPSKLFEEFEKTIENATV